MDVASTRPQKRKAHNTAWKMNPVDQPLWAIEKFVAGKWGDSSLQTTDIVGGKLKACRPRGATVTYHKAVAIFAQAKVQWPKMDTSVYRIRNKHTGDIIMGALL